MVSIWDMTYTNGEKRESCKTTKQLRGVQEALMRQKHSKCCLFVEKIITTTFESCRMKISSQTFFLKN
jgi:hypothetical protein